MLGQQGKATIGDRALCPGDIAVLVRKNRQARLMQEELIKHSIPSVLYGAESIFVSHEAQEVERLLSAVTEPGNEMKLKVALATDMLGYSGNDVYALRNKQNEWEDVLARFHQYHDHWAQYGFMRMFRKLIKNEGVRRRLLSFRNGERCMTNLLQCAEVLHRAEIEQKLGMDGLIKWFSVQRSAEDTAEENQIRLETDENAVKLITTHRSKGLEYPIVFCPFAWDSSKIKKEPFAFHDKRHDERLTLDLGTGDEGNKIDASIEELAENMRLLYVALTRAKHRCYLVWGKINEAETAAPAYLFHQPEQGLSGNIVAELEERVKQLSYDEMLTDVSALQDSSGDIRVSHLPVFESAPYASIENPAAALECRQFTRTIERDWMISSYSALISDRSARPDEPDYDRVYDMTIAPKTITERNDIFSFPHGAIAGNCIHRIFENLDFNFNSPEKERELIRNCLASYGIEAKWQEVLWDMAQRVVSLPLASSRPEFALKNIKAGHRLHELEFYFPLELITAQGLAAVLPARGDRDITARMMQLGFSPVRGYMRGFIDMVFWYGDRFYLVDWKSNYLGDSIESYAPAVLQRAMEENYYILQYHLYVVALHRYLSLRKADYEYTQHFGGVYYIFVRGVDPQHGSAYGIYHDRPAYELITSLSNYLTCRKQ
jgi:exodeoxyribonuclease V beta subunit